MVTIKKLDKIAIPKETGIENVNNNLNVLVRRFLKFCSFKLVKTGNRIYEKENIKLDIPVTKIHEAL